MFKHVFNKSVEIIEELIEPFLTEEPEEEIVLGVTGEIRDLFVEYRTCLELRDISINASFTTRKSIKYGKTAERSRLKAWSLVRELYPEHNTQIMSYNFDEEKLYMKK